MNMRNATCMGRQTSKVPTRVALLFIFYSVHSAKIVFFYISPNLRFGPVKSCISFGVNLPACSSIAPSILCRINSLYTEADQQKRLEHFVYVFKKNILMQR